MYPTDLFVSVRTRNAATQAYAAAALRLMDRSRTFRVLELPDMAEAAFAAAQIAARAALAEYHDPEPS